jgi:hypothetical protein
MFEMLGNLAKAAVSVAVAPVALAVDIVTLPASAEDPHRGAFDRTAALLDNAGDCVKAAVTPEQKS